MGEEPHTDQPAVQSRACISVPNRRFWKRREYDAALGRFLEFRGPNMLEVHLHPPVTIQWWPGGQRLHVTEDSRSQCDWP